MFGFARLRAKEIFSERRKRVFAANGNLQIVLVDRLRQSFDRLQVSEHVVAVLDRPRVYVDIVRFGLSHRLQALVHFLVSDGGLCVLNGQSAVRAQLDVGRNFEFSLEPYWLTGSESGGL